MTRTLRVLALVAFVGCGPMANPKLQNDAKQLAIGYHNYHDSINKGPADDKAFLELAQKMNDKDPQLLIQDAQNGEWVIHYGVKFTNLTDGTSRTVLASPQGHPNVRRHGGAWPTGPSGP